MPDKKSPFVLQDYKSSFVQNDLIDNLKQYFILRARKNTNTNVVYDLELPYNSHEGICSALVAFWAYSLRTGRIKHFFELLQHVLNWQAVQYEAAPFVEDPLIEEFLNITMFLQFDAQLRPDILLTDWSASFGLLLSTDYPSFDNAEFNTTFVFNPEALHELLSKVIKPEKVLRFGNGLHSIGLILHDDKYYFYNPSAMPEAFASLEQVAHAVINSAAAFGQTGQYQALNLLIFDLKTASDVNKETYTNPYEIYQSWLQDSQYKSQLINNPKIFHLAAKYQDIPMLKLLGAAGHVYKPWRSTMNTELHQAIVDRAYNLLDYLLSIGLPVNFARQDSLTPLGLAVNQDNFEMVCMLLAAGADPNLDIDNATKNYKAIEFALAIKADKDIIAVLLGHGAKVTARVRRLMQKSYTAEEQALIYANAETVRSEKQIYHEKTRIYQFIHDSPRALNFWQLRTLLHDLKHVFAVMFAKPIQQHTHFDLIELRTILLILDNLIQPQSLNPISKLIATSSTKTKRQIDQYLQENGVVSLDTYISLHPAVKRHQAGVYFATIGTETSPLAYANSVFQLLKL